MRNLRDEVGDTLVEVLITILIVSTAGLALLQGFSVTIQGSAEHRYLAGNDLVLRAAAESAFAMLQQQASPRFQICPNLSPYSGYANLQDEYNSIATANGYSNFGAPSTYTAQIVDVQYWLNSAWSSTPPTHCTVPVPEEIQFTVTNSLNVSESTTFVVNDVNANSNSAITVVSMSPSTIAEGANLVPVTISGQGFTTNDSVSFSNTSIKAYSVSLGSPTQLTALISVPADPNVVPLGSYDVIVSDTTSAVQPGTGHGLLTVTPSATVSGSAPSVLAATANTTLTITGYQFQPGMQVTFTPGPGTPTGGSPISVDESSVTVTSSTTATVSVSTTSATSVGGYIATVILPGNVPSKSTSGIVLTMIKQPVIISAVTSSTSTSPCDPGYLGTANCLLTGTSFEQGATFTILNSANAVIGVVNSVTITQGSNGQPDTALINVSGTGTTTGEYGSITIINPDNSSSPPYPNGFQNGVN